MKVKKIIVLGILIAIIIVFAGFFIPQLALLRGMENGLAGVAPERPEEPPPVVGEPEVRAEEPGAVESPEPENPPDGPVMATAHFARDEYRCDCAGYCDGWPCEMNPVLLNKIEALRCACGAPIIITSGVRCPARNAEVGGVSWSFHKRGDAADLYCPGVAVGDLAQMARAFGMNVLPYYGSGYIHVEI